MTASSERNGYGDGDVIDGGDDNDSLSGLGGDDTLIVGNGKDGLAGGFGNDLREPAVGFKTDSLGEVWVEPSDRGWNGIKLLQRGTYPPETPKAPRTKSVLQGRMLRWRIGS